MKLFSIKVFFQLFLACSLLSPITIIAQNKKDVAWEGQEDKVYQQEISTKIPTGQSITAVVAYGEKCFVVMGGQLYILDQQKLKKANEAPERISHLYNLEGEIWACTPEGLFVYNNKKWDKKDDRHFVDMIAPQGQIYAATKTEIFQWKKDHFVSTQPEGGYNTSDITQVMEDGSQVHVTPVKLGPITQIALYSGTLYVLRPGQLVLFDGKEVNEDFIDWGRLPSPQTNEMLSRGSRLFVGTNKGLAVLRGAAMHTIKGEDGLPIEATTCLSKGFAGDMWIGTEHGAIRMTKTGDFQYFGKGMWLPGERVNDIAVGDKKVYIATDEGLGVIRYEPFTLRKKADWYEKYIEKWGYKRMGFIQYLYKKDGKWIREITDNDGSHTANYLVAMCYKYAVTGDEAARNEAVKSFKAMLCLEEITGIDGLIARSIWSAADEDTRSTSGSGGLPAHWHPVSGGKWYWKGDVSSDEVDAHFYSVSLFHDLVAKGKEKKLAEDHLRKIATYIIDCGWTMHGVNGKPTRWARWNPDYLLSPYGGSDRGLNSLEVLSFMRAAIALTGEQKIKEGYQQLKQWGYPQYTIRQKNTFPPEDIAPWDDDLAFMSYMTLLRYERDSIMRPIYLRSLQRTWSIKRIDQSPWFNFAYSALTGNKGDLGAAVRSMRERTLDCRENSYFNSQRDDLFIQPGYHSYDGRVTMLSPREVFIGDDGRAPGKLDGHRKGNRAVPPTGFLRDYWMARYYGIIQPPEAKNAGLLSVSPEQIPEGGAARYAGPALPDL